MPSFITFRPASVRRWIWLLDITFVEADQFYLVDLQSQLTASGWPYHVQALVTAPPAAPASLTFHREPAQQRRQLAGDDRLRPGLKPGGASAPRVITARADQGARGRRPQGKDFRK